MATKIINLENAKRIIIDDDDVFVVNQGEDGEINIYTQIVPSIIDSNFKELEERLRILEEKNENLALANKKLESKINILNAVIKGN